MAGRAHGLTAQDIFKSVFCQWMEEEFTKVWGDFTFLLKLVMMSSTQPNYKEGVTHLDDLLETFEVSTRTYNVCFKYGLLELQQLITFYIKIGDFTVLHGAGRKTHEELEKICRYCLCHMNEVFQKRLVPEEKLDKRGAAATIDSTNLAKQKLNVLEAYVKEKFQKLSVRSQNALSQFLNYQVSYTAIHQFFFFEKVPISKLRNVGSKTITEIEVFFTDLKMYAYEVEALQEDDLTANFLSRQLSLSLNLQPHFWEIFLPQMREKHFPIFAFLQKLIFEGSLFNASQTVILCHRFGWFKEEGKQSLDEIASKLSLTRERVRQIALSMAEDLPGILKFLGTYKTQLLELSGGHGLGFDKDLVFIQQVVADEINLREQTTFTPKFFATAFSFLYSDTYMLFGEHFDFFQNHYLVRREFVEVFDLTTFIGDLHRQVSARIEEDYSLDLDGYLYSFLKTPNMSILPRVRRVCEDLIFLEFNEKVWIEPSGNLIVLRNKKRQIWEYAFEALENIGVPAKLDFIHQTIIEIYPDFDLNLEALRGTLTKEKSRFISFSRTSTYGLVQWETERADIRGGTIRDIAKEYLQQFSEPKHYYDITNFVLLYRPDTSPKSVHANLQYDMSGRFREFAAGFWGLTERDYGDFQPRRFTPQVLTYFKAWLSNNPNASLEDAVEYLSRRWHVQPIQSMAWLDEKLRSSILRLENDKFLVLI
ncbi:MAG: hypothetical protein SFV52_10440 [Saprospiraceae bacterium]|nr:hypothetical protein [Saprospiraceae bacterium]